jgi:hypothetical protein
MANFLKKWKKKKNIEKAVGSLKKGVEIALKPTKAKPSANFVATRQRLEAMAEKRGIRLVWVLMPRLAGNDGPETAALWQSIPADRKIDAGNPAKLPELYTIENSGDNLHLNDAGGRILTRWLFDRYRELPAASGK